jgi:UDP-N-acetylglucosamine--N-acetylmuramyl-(pentapeptide) pyrophosphoryl-undecaprenol N-acetylglucosamine transferase
MALVQKDAAILVKDAEANEWIMKKPLEILSNREKAEALSQHIKALARPHAAEDIARQVLALMNDKR